MTSTTPDPDTDHRRRGDARAAGATRDGGPAARTAGAAADAAGAAADGGDGQRLTARPYSGQHSRTGRDSATTATSTVTSGTRRGPRRVYREGRQLRHQVRVEVTSGRSIVPSPPPALTPLWGRGGERSGGARETSTPMTRS